MPGCAVRDAEIDEAPSIVALVRSAFAESREWDAPSSALLETEARWRDGMGAHVFRVLVCGEPAGLAGVVRYHCDDDGWWMFARLAVAPDQRRRGVATRLLRALEERARASGAPGLRCTARAGEGGGSALYAANGFVDAGTADVVRNTVRIPVVRWEKPFRGGASR